MLVVLVCVCFMFELYFCFSDLVCSRVYLVICVFFRVCVRFFFFSCLCVRDAMNANRGSLLTTSNLVGKTQCNQERIRRVLDYRVCPGNHLWDIQETNSQQAYHTHTQMIARVCPGSEPGLLGSN